MRHAQVNLHDKYAYAYLNAHTTYTNPLQALKFCSFQAVSRIEIQQKSGEPSIPPAATVPTFSRNSTNLLAFVPAEIIRRCPNENSAGRCGCQDDPYVKFDCPLGDATCGCYRCPESLGSSFILHEGLCFEACPDDTPVDHHPVFFESADPAVADQAPSMTYSPWSAPIKETDAKLVSTVCSDSCTWGCVPCEWPVLL